jgi:hypothetical protein
MTQTDPLLLYLPVGLERELDAIGVRRAFSLRPAKRTDDWSFKRPVLDDNNQPEF